MRFNLRRFAPWGWRCAALLSVAGVVAISRLATPSKPVSSPPDPPAISVACKGLYNNADMTQAQLDGVVEKHRVYLTGLTGGQIGLNKDPYALVTRQAVEIARNDAGLADAMPPSLTGLPMPVPDTGRADLCGARLAGLTLAGKDLRHARLMGARLDKVDLTGAILHSSYWRRAGLRNVTATDASFKWADLTGTLIYDSSFVRADFFRSELSFMDSSAVDFTDARFENAALVSATLRDANLERANFNGANLSYLVFEPRLGFLPRVGAFRSVTGLSTLQSHREAGAALRELQQAIEEKGMKSEGAQVRAALNQAKGVGHYPLQSAFAQLAYQLPYEFGERPERLLIIGLLLIPTFAVFYFFALKQPRESAIWKIPDAPPSDPDAKPTGVMLTAHNCNPIRMAFIFSIRSAFRIGWKDFNVGEWLSRMHGEGYRLEAIGWVRSIAGMQSLLSVYLLALAIISYIGS